MGSLPRPKLEPGAHRDLVDALHDLHHRAGWPSLRALGRAAGCSHTTVSTVFSSSRLPSWGLLELLVETMHGDLAELRRLWVAAGEPSAADPPVPLIAGRRTELTVARRHLEDGAGLLMVTGEAGMGKTRLVGTAASLASATTFSAVGSCLPLSMDVPLLPVVDLLRAAYDRDGGCWVTQGLSDCAPYVAASVRRILPELEPVASAEHLRGDHWSRQRLFGALGAMLEALAARHPFAVVVEDVHWADPGTLDLLEHLLVRRVGVPLLGTWRLEDPGSAPHAAQWWSRVQRLSCTTTLPLHPLSRKETAEQVELLTPGEDDPDRVDRIYRRSRGQPLFTEQLSAQTEGQPMPPALAELLDRRLDGLGDEAWRVARALGVADRPLDDVVLSDVTGMGADGLSTALHDLESHHLLGSVTGHRVELHHPLEAEAIRRRLVRLESVAEHRRIAEALGRAAEPSFAEVAEHWQRAEEPGQEIVWRIRAARAASQQFALAQAGVQWRRVLDLWPAPDETAGSPPLGRGAAYLATLDALAHIDVLTGWEVAQQAMGHETVMGGPDAPGIYLRAADIRWWLGDPAGGLALVERAIDLLGAEAPTADRVRALHARDALLDALGRYDESRAASAQALAAYSGCDDPRLLRSLLVQQAIHQTDTGHIGRGLACLEAATVVEVREPDPEGDLRLAGNHTYMLLLAGRVADEVVEAGRPGLESAATWGLETTTSHALRANMAQALVRAGRVRAAAALVDPVTSRDHPTYEDLSVQEVRATLDMLRGRPAEALARCDLLTGFPSAHVENRFWFAGSAASVELWCGRPAAAWARTTAVLRESLTTDAAAWSSGVLAVAARAAAEVADADLRGPRRRHDLGAELRDLHHSARHDPFEASPVRADRPAHAAAWKAECARLAGRPSLELWVESARQWERLGHPHDAGYARWRGAQLALGAGDGTTAMRLLRRAAREAREHVPLGAAIAASRAYLP